MQVASTKTAVVIANSVPNSKIEPGPTTIGSALKGSGESNNAAQKQTLPRPR
jgi:hypothetical protein